LIVAVTWDKEEDNTGTLGQPFLIVGRGVGVQLPLVVGTLKCCPIGVLRMHKFVTMENIRATNDTSGTAEDLAG
jgi:hypothetical protein